MDSTPVKLSKKPALPYREQVETKGIAVQADIAQVLKDVRREMEGRHAHE